MNSWRCGRASFRSDWNRNGGLMNGAGKVEANIIAIWGCTRDIVSLEWVFGRAARAYVLVI